VAVFGALVVGFASIVVFSGIGLIVEKQLSWKPIAPSSPAPQPDRGRGGSTRR